MMDRKLMENYNNTTVIAANHVKETAIHLFQATGLTDGRDCSDDFTKLEFVQYGSLTSCIETYHKNPHLFLGEKPAEQLREGKPHLYLTPAICLKQCYWHSHLKQK